MIIVAFNIGNAIKNLSKTLCFFDFLVRLLIENINPIRMGTRSTSIPRAFPTAAITDPI